MLFQFTSGQTSRLTKITARARRFRDDEDGAIVIFTLFTFMVMFVMGGLAVDVMHQENKRVELQHTLDSAVLASANLRQTKDPQDVVRDYFTKAQLVQYLNPMTATDYAVKTNNRRVQASAAMQVNTHFIKMAGIPRLSIATLAAAEQSNQDGAPENKEVSIVLDISRAMATNNRLEELKTSTKDIITTLLTGDAANTTSINLVPYAGHVNPGREMYDILGGVDYGTTGLDIFPESRKDISNVVFYYDRITTDAAEYDYAAKIEGYPDLDVDLFNKDDLDEYVNFADAYIRRQDANLADDDVLVGLSYKAGKTHHGPYLMDGTIGSFATRNDSTVDSEHQFTPFYAEVIPQYASCVEIDTASFGSAALPDDPAPAQVPHFNADPIDAAKMDWGWCPEDDSAIQYAQNDELALHRYVDDLRLHDGNGTHYAMKYALALLDPSSQDEFQTLYTAGDIPFVFADRPKPYSDESLKKYIILLSAGGISDQPRPVHPLDPANTTYALSERAESETQPLETANANLTEFYAMCDMAKANGVEIYTIAFEADAAGQAQMRHCASSPSHYFNAQDSDLSGVFGSVSQTITQLRLTQ